MTSRGRLRVWWSALVLTALMVGGMVSTAHAAPGSGFNSRLGSGFNERVETVVVQRDGKVLVGGSFFRLDEADVPRGLMRLNADGSPDTAFNSRLGSGLGWPRGFTATVSPEVQAIAVGADGKILVGGYFGTFNGRDVPDYLMRLNADGSPDTAFNARLGSGLDWVADSLALRQDGAIIVAGGFKWLNRKDVPDYLMRLKADGSPDAAFNARLGAGLDVPAATLLTQTSGKLLVGGTFTQLNGRDVPDHLLRLNADGSPDTVFNAKLGEGFDLGVDHVAEQSEGAILVGGMFRMLNGKDVPDGLIRLRANGSPDNSFNVKLAAGFEGGEGVDGLVRSFAVQRNGKVVVGGDFDTLGGLSVPEDLLRLNADGTPDTRFNSNLGTGLDRRAYSIAVQRDGKVLVAGFFSTLNDTDVPDRLVRLNGDGTRDS